MSFERKLEVYLRARFSLIVLVTMEEERAIQTVKQLCEQSNKKCLTWDVADGFQGIAHMSGPLPMAKDPGTALDCIDKMDDEAIIVLKDFHEAWNNALFKRKLRSVAQRLKYTKKNLIVTCPVGRLPDELRDEAVVLDYDLPDNEEMQNVLDRLTQNPGIRVQLTGLGREKLVQAALGLTATQAQRAFARAIVADGRLDDRGIQVVTEEKKQIIRESQALEFYGHHESPEDLGGLGVLKNWLKLRERAFTQDARDYGLPAPKGMALIGIPGTGKSLTAKMIGAMWQLPLLRLDVGALFGSLVGESEQRARQALKLAETVAPCILWIDEMEKAFAQGGLDGGTSTRVFGTILTWMQEKTAPVFVIATANNIAGLPPELLRRGRFDEIFFLDLPTPEERQEIFRVHLRKRRRDAKDFDVSRLARETDGFVGAELEQAILDAMYVGFNESREFTTSDLLHAIKRQVPLSVSQRETIHELRRWLLEGRAQSASFQEAREAKDRFVMIEPLEPLLEGS